MKMLLLIIQEQSFVDLKSSNIFHNISINEILSFSKNNFGKYY
jgi:hypothetical protein